MNHEQADATVTQGRKGVAYDWQSIYVAAQMESLDRELDAFLRRQPLSAAQIG